MGFGLSGAVLFNHNLLIFLKNFCVYNQNWFDLKQTKARRKIGCQSITICRVSKRLCSYCKSLLKVWSFNAARTQHGRYFFHSKIKIVQYNYVHITSHCSKFGHLTQHGPSMEDMIKSRTLLKCSQILWFSLAGERYFHENIVS